MLQFPIPFDGVKANKEVWDILMQHQNISDAIEPNPISLLIYIIL